ncbi:PHD finger protein MALE STERILITY 1 [Platanthera zijinensis]|uniref:PHD finger protein MALE STERILITY 1 n=1 Tax=Platanthera zijinensis TaxID=2320716 RepID=A0AAP0BSR1_9ASPA
MRDAQQEPSLAHAVRFHLRQPGWRPARACLARRSLLRNPPSQGHGQAPLRVSLIDVAKKEKMELRLIHGLAYGVPWFEQWGYKFGHGSYGIAKQLHERSLQALRRFPLSLISLLSYTIHDSDISKIATRYRVMSNQPPITLGDLFRCMIELKRRLPRENTPATMDFHSVVTATSCRWSIKRVEIAALVIVQVLKEFGHRWITRQEIRDASRVFIGDTGLLDFVLKSLGNHIVATVQERV